MAMTVNKLHKILGEMIEVGQGRRHVCVAKHTFTDNRELDGVTILDVHTAKPECIFIADDYGGMAMLKNGEAKTRNIFVLGGCASEQS